MSGAGGVVPREVIEALRSSRGIHTGLRSLRIRSLSDSNPIFRIDASEGSWIVKRSRDPRKDMVVSDLFRAWEIPSFGVEALFDDWLALEDLHLPALGDLLRRGLPAERLFGALGTAAAQAELVGMRDRKLANILVDDPGGPEPPRAILIDYEGAFCAGLFDRAVRPRRYVSYLLRRFFLDVLDGASGGPAPAGGIRPLFDRFREGLLREQGRLNEAARRSPRTRFPLTARQRLTLWTRIGSGRRLDTLLGGAFRIARIQERSEGCP